MVETLDAQLAVKLVAYWVAQLVGQRVAGKVAVMVV